jgi:hypothetical protein
VEGVSEFEDREHFPEPWIAEEEAQGAALGMVSAGIAQGLFFCLSLVLSDGGGIDIDGLGFPLSLSSLGIQ